MFSSIAFFFLLINFELFSAFTNAIPAYSNEEVSDKLGKMQKGGKKEWVEHCVAEYERKMGKSEEKKSSEEEGSSYEVNYPPNYEPAFDYGKLHVSDIILPLKIHKEQVGTGNGSTYGGHMVASENGEYLGSTHYGIEEESGERNYDADIGSNDGAMDQTNERYSDEDEKSYSNKEESYEADEESYAGESDSDEAKEEDSEEGNSDETAEDGGYSSDETDEEYSNESREGISDSEPNESLSEERNVRYSDEIEEKASYSDEQKDYPGEGAYNRYSKEESESHSKEGTRYLGKGRHPYPRRHHSKMLRKMYRPKHPKPLRFPQYQPPNVPLPSIPFPPSHQQFLLPPPPAPIQLQQPLPSQQQMPSSLPVPLPSLPQVPLPPQQMPVQQQPPPIGMQPPVSVPAPSPPSSVPQQAPTGPTICSRQPLEKCSPFSRCIDGTGPIHNCWTEGIEMVFDGATQGCRSFAALPDCKQDGYCTNRTFGRTLVGGGCTKLTFMCDVAQQSAMRPPVLPCPGNSVVDPNTFACTDRSQLLACANFP